MENSLTVVERFNEKFGKIRMAEIDGKPYAIGIDIAKALEYAKPSQAVIDHCKGIRKLRIPSKGGIQETNVIPEGDIFRLITKASEQSKNPDIKERAKRIEKGIKQKDFAEELGITPQYLCKIEKGETEPRRDLMIKISKALNTGLQELFFSEEN